MKRTLIAISLVLAAASTSFAAATANIVWADAGKNVVGGNDASVTTPKQIGKLSTGVSMAFNTATTGYALITQHKNGVKAFGTSADSTAIYQMPVTKEATTAAPNATTSADFLTGDWTSM
ncbi:MAG: hypothetical protein GJT30_01095 [Geobacter sp.]|nr:hypothetical protein [Geobacter sp.]